MRVTDPKDACMSIFTFGTKTILPNHIPVTQLTLDVSNFRDPTGAKSLKGKTGMDPEVQAYISYDPRLQSLLSDLVRTIADVRTINPGGWVSVSIFDHHGRMASVAVGELLGQKLDQLLPQAGYRITHINLLKDQTGYMIQQSYPPAKLTGGMD